MFTKSLPEKRSRLEEHAFPKRTLVLMYPLPFLCHFFCSDLIRNALSCSHRVPPDQVHKPLRSAQKGTLGIFTEH